MEFPDTYLLLKWVHVISSTILFGTGIGSAFVMFMANRSRNINSIAFATRHVVVADWLFTTPAVIVQLLTGLALVHMGGFALTEGWVMAAMVLYILTGAFWIPVVVIQLRMRDLAHTALAQKAPLPEAYWKLNRGWVTLGALAFPTVVVIFYLMVIKP